MTDIKVKVPKWKKGDVIKQTTRPAFRTVLEVITPYLNTKGRFGYWYEDDLGFRGLCSEEHLAEWSKR